MKTITIGNRLLQIKDYYCTNNEDYVQKNDEKLWLYVYITDFCTGNCPFCVNGKPGTSCSQFDIKRFQQVLNSIKKHIHGISFTGGEPLLEVEILENTIKTVTDTFPEYIELDLVTSGYNLDRLIQLNGLNSLTSIHLSRHAIRDEINQSIMGFDAPEENAIRRTIDKMDDPSKIVFNCVLQKGGIDSINAMADYLEMAADVGIDNTSFIGLFMANEYCQEHYVDPKHFHFDEDSRFRIWNSYKDYDYCSCSSGDYQAKDRWVRFYYRSPGNVTPDYSRQLVYTSDNRLLAGFGGTEIEV